MCDATRPSARARRAPPPARPEHPRRPEHTSRERGASPDPSAEEGGRRGLLRLRRLLGLRSPRGGGLAASQRSAFPRLLSWTEHNFKGIDTAVQVEICEGHGVQPEEVTIIGKVILADLPPRPKGTPIDVVYRYTVDARLEIDVLDVETGASHQAEVLLTGGMEAEGLDEARSRISETEVR